jgi:hypothetical protein
MSTTQPLGLDTEEQIVRIKRAIAESDKFAAEQRKLSAEADKLNRDRWLAPLLTACIALLAALASVVAAYLSHR